MLIYTPLSTGITVVLPVAPTFFFFLLLLFFFTPLSFSIFIGRELASAINFDNSQMLDQIPRCEETVVAISFERNEKFYAIVFEIVNRDLTAFFFYGSNRSRDRRSEAGSAKRRRGRIGLRSCTTRTFGSAFSDPSNFYLSRNFALSLPLTSFLLGWRPSRVLSI